MKFFLIQLLCISLFVSDSAYAQIDTTVTKTQQQQELFNAEESTYLNQWFAEFVEEMNLSDEVATQYQEITESYSNRMDRIGNNNPKITKSEIVEQFNTLMKSQHEELRPILTEKQYEMYYETMKNVVWSINQRLRQL